MPSIDHVISSDKLKAAVRNVSENGGTPISLTAAMSIPGYLTKGQKYELSCYGDDATILYFTDDAGREADFRGSEKYMLFEHTDECSMFDDELLNELKTQTSWLLTQVDLLEKAIKAFEPGDVVVELGDDDVKVMIVVRMLSHEEMRDLSLRLGCYVCGDVMLFKHTEHSDDYEADVVFRASHRLRRVGSLSEWGMSMPDSKIVKHLTPL